MAKIYDETTYSVELPIAKGSLAKVSLLSDALIADGKGGAKWNLDLKFDNSMCSFLGCEKKFNGSKINVIANFAASKSASGSASTSISFDKSEFESGAEIEILVGVGGAAAEAHSTRRIRKIREVDQM